MKSMDIPVHSLVRVVWCDSNFNKGWHPMSKKTALVSTIVTIGYVTHSGGDTLEVGSTIGMDDGAKLNPLSIPWGCIEECKVFNHKKVTDVVQKEN